MTDKQYYAHRVKHWEEAYKFLRVAKKTRARYVENAANDDVFQRKIQEEKLSNLLVLQEHISDVSSNGLSPTTIGVSGVASRTALIENLTTLKREIEDAIVALKAL